MASKRTRMDSEGMKLIRITQVFVVFVNPLLKISSKEAQQLMNMLLRFPIKKLQLTQTSKAVYP